MFYEVALTQTHGIGNTLAKHLVSYCGSAENVFKENKGKLMSIPNIGESIAEKIINHKDAFTKAEKILKKCEKEEVKILFYTFPDFPSRLKQLYDAPVLLYFKGNANLNASKSISIVGTRQSTNYGKEITENIVAALTPYNPLIVSGLAYGIDIIAHRAALRYNLQTIGCMASGMDTIYPAAHKKTAQTMLVNGGLITEYPPGTKPDAPHFPERNRIIAALSDLTIVVEAAAKGGALITAEFANGYGKDVMAVPGKLGDLYSEGCNNLIKKHKAHIYTNPKDIVELLNWDIQTDQKINKSAFKQIQLPMMSEKERIIFELLSKEQELMIDDISWKSQISINETATILLNLEFMGIVKPLPGKRYRVGM
ncbi:MAG: DNA-processing protein DprA [Cytophagales bacterium]